MSLGLKKQTMVIHNQHGLCLIGGNQRGVFSINNIETGKRITNWAKGDECKVLKRANFLFKQIGEIPIDRKTTQLTLF